MFLRNAPIASATDTIFEQLPSLPGWRNWQTQRTQNPPTFGSWGFDSPSRHHANPFRENQVGRTAAEELRSSYSSCLGRFSAIVPELTFRRRSGFLPGSSFRVVSQLVRFQSCHRVVDV